MSYLEMSFLWLTSKPVPYILYSLGLLTLSRYVLDAETNSEFSNSKYKTISSKNWLLFHRISGTERSVENKPGNTKTKYYFRRQMINLNSLIEDDNTKRLYDYHNGRFENLEYNENKVYISNHREYDARKNCKNNVQ